MRIGDVEGADEDFVLRGIVIVDDVVDAFALNACPACPEGDDDASILCPIIVDTRAACEDKQGGSEGEGSEKLKGVHCV